MMEPFFFELKCATLGTYTFALDASCEKSYFKHRIYLYAIHDDGVITRAEGVWENRYDTGSWNQMVENYGGSSASKPYYVRRCLERNTATLAVNFFNCESLRGGIQVDRLRVTDFTNGWVESLSAHKKRFSNLID